MLSLHKSVWILSGVEHTSVNDETNLLKKRSKKLLKNNSFKNCCHVEIFLHTILKSLLLTEVLQYAFTLQRRTKGDKSIKTMLKQTYLRNVIIFCYSLS